MHSVLFFNPRLWNREKNSLPLNNGKLSVPQELTRSKTPLKVYWSPWASEAGVNFYHISCLHIHPVFSWFKFSFRQIKRLCVRRDFFHASMMNQVSCICFFKPSVMWVQFILKYKVDVHLAFYFFFCCWWFLIYSVRYYK